MIVISSFAFNMYLLLYIHLMHLHLQDCPNPYILSTPSMHETTYRLSLQPLHLSSQLKEFSL
jgi:hypothetical protein